jgi:hypothetical protein
MKPAEVTGFLADGVSVFLASGPVRSGPANGGPRAGGRLKDAQAALEQVYKAALAYLRALQGLSMEARKALQPLETAATALAQDAVNRFLPECYAFATSDGQYPTVRASPQGQRSAYRAQRPDT